MTQEKIVTEAKKLANRVIREAVEDIREVDILRVSRRQRLSDPVVKEALELIEAARIEIKWGL